MTIPSAKGVKVSLGKNRHVGSSLSHRYVSQFRDAFYRAGLVAVSRGYQNRETGKFEASRVTPAIEFVALAARSGMKLADLVKPPVEVLVMRNGLWTTPPKLVLESAGTIQAVNLVTPDTGTICQQMCICAWRQGCRQGNGSIAGQANVAGCTLAGMKVPSSPSPSASSPATGA